MCDCVNVEIGSYANQVCFTNLDSHMLFYLSMFPSGAQETICIDKCLVDEILKLWRMGITTTGCCCGHNKLRGYIGVIDKDIPRMKALGYEVHPNNVRPGAEDSFYPKSIL